MAPGTARTKVLSRHDRVDDGCRLGQGFVLITVCPGAYEHPKQPATRSDVRGAEHARRADGIEVAGPKIWRVNRTGSSLGRPLGRDDDRDSVRRQRMRHHARRPLGQQRMQRKVREPDRSQTDDLRNRPRKGRAALWDFTPPGRKRGPEVDSAPWKVARRATAPESRDRRRTVVCTRRPARLWPGRSIRARFPSR
jgi:hypothetical protein